MTAALKSPDELVRRRFPAVGECAMPPGEEACTQTGCRYHLAQRGHWEHHLQPTRDCALDVANEGPRSLEEVAEIMGVSKERVRQIEERALEKLKDSDLLRRLYDESE